jgi:hypothetical protein
MGVRRRRRFVQQQGFGEVHKLDCLAIAFLPFSSEDLKYIKAIVLVLVLFWGLCDLHDLQNIGLSDLFNVGSRWGMLWQWWQQRHICWA